VTTMKQWQVDGWWYSAPLGDHETYYHVRRDPSSPAPDYVLRNWGEVCHFQETGHTQAKGCCSLVDANGRHLLPRFRQPKTDT